ncbi:hypothetical protein [Arthrobacter roseus]|uniref:hypothetical protein n=1 Tax=Arthrobacter roseus TaxID=136274 RepID=UPI0019628CEF|nr:hypothetical protein [Arthrobacter roseus]MBM7847391.1 hypothetical protein [Arthrobacter roseus]
MAGSGMFGSNPDQLRTLAKSATQGSLELVQLQRIISRKLEECQWSGPDAVKFRTLWNTDIAPRIHGAAESMSSVSKQLRRSAEDQEGVSSASSSSTVGGFPAADNLLLTSPLVPSELEPESGQISPIVHETMPIERDLQ